MQRLIESNPKNSERVFPYIGGKELNSHPSQQHSRFVINFGEMTEDEARQWPELFAIVEEKVKPARLVQKREIRKRYWWRFGETTPSLFEAVSRHKRILVCARTSKYLSFAFLPNGMVYSESTVVIALDSAAAFGVLQSQCHLHWALFFGTTMKDDPVYTPPSCFETFPFAEPSDTDREVVDLLFFPTGGGKTEAYLGLAAFTLVLRRLRNPGISSAGLSVLMRYTLRLLTLDQLSRAAALICALELERQQDVTKLGEWPFEIGLWVGKAATPNRMGQKGDKYSESARAKTIAFKNNDRNKPSPIPLEECPWCGEKFKRNSFQLLPNPDTPTDLRVTCANRRCEFSHERYLPIIAVAVYAEKCSQKSTETTSETAIRGLKAQINYDQAIHVMFEFDRNAILSGDLEKVILPSFKGIIVWD